MDPSLSAACKRIKRKNDDEAPQIGCIGIQGILLEEILHDRFALSRKRTANERE